MTTNKTFDQWIQEAKSLRRQAEQYEERFLRFLIEFEASGAWQDAGFSTFSMLLRQQKLCDSARFDAFKQATATIGEVTKEIGVAAAVEATKITNAKDRVRYVQEAKVREAEEGTCWSPQMAKTARLKFQPDPEYRSQIERKATKLEEAEATIRTLRAELRAVKRERDELLAKVAAFSSKKGTARKAPEARA